MCQVRCPQFIHNSHKLRSKIVDKKLRKVHLLKVCCGNYAECEICKK